jgi:hypothetical protein
MQQTFEQDAFADSCILKVEDLSQLSKKIQNSLSGESRLWFRTKHEGNYIESDNLNGFLAHENLPSTLYYLNIGGEGGNISVNVEISNFTGSLINVKGPRRHEVVGLLKELTDFIKERKQKFATSKSLLSSKVFASLVMGVAFAFLIKFVMESGITISIIASVSWLYLFNAYMDLSRMPRARGTRIIIRKPRNKIMSKQTITYIGITIAILNLVNAIFQAILKMTSSGNP